MLIRITNYILDTDYIDIYVDENSMFRVHKKTNLGSEIAIIESVTYGGTLALPPINHPNHTINRTVSEIIKFIDNITYLHNPLKISTCLENIKAIDFYIPKNVLTSVDGNDIIAVISRRLYYFFERLKHDK